MVNNNKKLRKLENIKLLVISQDGTFVNEVNNLFDSINQLKVTASNVEALELLDAIAFDVVVIDTKSDNCVEFLSKIEETKQTPLKIVILDEENEEDIVNAVNYDAYTILSKPFNIVNLKIAIIMSLNQTKRSDKVKLGQGFHYDVYRDRVYNRYGKAIELTKLELGLLKLLIDNWKEVVDYKAIEEKVWKGKKMSIFTMRNVVNKIRTKTYYDIFKNASSKGYIID